ncbi:ABC transporter permease [Mycolicibacterium sp. CBM1]
MTAIAPVTGMFGLPKVRPRFASAPAGVGVCVLLLLATAAIIVAPLLAVYDPVQPAGDPNLPPLTAHHLLGTDALGRDLLSRTLFGMRTSWLSALAIVAVGLIAGGVIGVVAGAAGGWIDAILMRTTDLFLAMPAALVAIAVVAALGPGLLHTIVGICVVWWPYYARILRGEIRSLAARPHVEAARLSGVGPVRITTRHLLPGAVPTAIVTASVDIGNVVLLLAGLSFLGLGQRQPAPELGSDTASGMQQVLSQWWVPVIPATAVLVLSLAANLAGDAMSKSVGTRV